MFDCTNEDAIQAVVDTLRSGTLLRYDHPDGVESPVTRLEAAMASAIGVRRAVAVNSGGSGMQLALEACGLRAGDEVLMPAFTFVAVPSAVVLAGGVPRLVEVTDDYVIDCDDLEAKITPRSRILLLSYVRGRVPDLRRVLEICERRSLILIEDAAHAFGARWAGRPVGGLGHVGVVAFHGVVDSGEGAVVVTDDDAVADHVVIAAGCYDQNWCKHAGVQHREEALRALANAVPAHSMRMGDLIGAVVLPQLDRAEALIERQRADAAFLLGLLSDTPSLRVPAVPANVHQVPWSIQLALEGVEPRLVKAFVSATAHHGIPMKVIGIDPHNSRCWWNWSFFQPNDCPRTRDLLCRTVDFVLPPGLKRGQLYFLAQAILDALFDATRDAIR